jgi:NADH-quinone oxidoreductase subunit D
MESYKICRQVIKEIPDGPLTVKVPARIPAGEAVSRYEAPRGEDFHYVRSNGSDKPERVKVRAPTLANSAAVAHMIAGGYLADVPIIIAAIDPCFSCTDRMIKVQDASSGKESMFNWEGLRKYSIDWYGKQGIDMQNVRLRKED